MPTGFDVESGAELSKKLLYLVPWLERTLRKHQTINPVTAKDLCVRCKSDNNIDIEGPDVRAMVNFFRRNENPVGSMADGYFWATERQQLDSTILHLRERISGISSALHGLEKAKEKIKRGQEELFT